MLVLGSMFKKGLPAHNHNIRTLRRVTEPILVLIFLAAIILTAWRGVHHIEQETRHSAGKALNTVLLTTQEALHLWAETRINDAKSLAARPVVV
ncbi:MAG: hypothetical protein QGF59_20650, partial [Pirellulaceae bacterium]|nr:hypothetical protein [Pirellulaceae bacterium]